MKVLGIDSAIPEASVALIAGDELLGEQRQTAVPAPLTPTAGKSPSNHAEIILLLIQTVLEKSSIAVEQLSGIAVSIGPGSFTGLRIGLATAKGLAYESGVPLIAVSTLQANAARVEQDGALIGSMLDARKNEVYVALFRRACGQFIRITDDAILPIDSAIALVKKHSPEADSSLILIGDGAKVHERQLNHCFGTTVRVLSRHCRPSVAATVAKIGAAEIARGSTGQSSPLVPVYLRLAEAELRRKNYF